MQHLPKLEQLLLNENQITEIKNLEALTSLNTFDISDNLVSKIQGLESQLVLEELWMTNNKVELFAELQFLRNLPGLRTIYLERCPIYSYPDYKMKILEECPRIKQIDALLVN